MLVTDKWIGIVCNGRKNIRSSDVSSVEDVQELTSTWC